VKVGVFVGAARPDAGGGFTIVDEVIRAARSSQEQPRHEFVILTSGDSSPYEDAYRGMPVVSLQTAFGGHPLPTRVGRFLRRKTAQALGVEGSVAQDYIRRAHLGDLIRRAGIDVIWYPSAWECVTLEVPFFTVVWDLQHRLQPFFPEVSADGVWESRERRFSTVLRRAALVITGTEVGRREIEQFYGVAPANIRIMPHPTPTFDVAAAPRAAPGADYLFYPAQFWAHKNHVNLLEALRLLRDRGEALRLVLTGADKGNLGFVRETITRLGLEGAVELRGFVSRAELVGLYRGAAALTYVTFFGPENLPPLEAFALACPVVASDVPGAREQLGDAALFVDPRRPEQIADAVSSLRRDQALRKSLIERGLARADRFRPRDFVAAVQEWLDDFAGVRRCWPSG
jgi:glycosyltransferase involved in cell wall biosynthesis